MSEQDATTRCGPADDSERPLAALQRHTKHVSLRVRQSLSPHEQTLPSFPGIQAKTVRYPL